MDGQQQIVITRSPKSMGVAYALLIFLGGLGLHRFYLDRVGSGVTLALLSVVGWLTVWFIVGIIPLAIVGICWFVDLFLTAGMVREANEKMGGIASVVTPPSIEASKAEEPR